MQLIIANQLPNVFIAEASLYRVLSRSPQIHSGQTLPVQRKLSVYISVNGAHTLSLCDWGPELWMIEQVSAILSCNGNKGIKMDPL